MKIKVFFLVLLLALGLSDFIYAQDDDRFVVSYFDSVPNANLRVVKQASKKPHLVSYRMSGDTVIKSRQGYFVASFDKKQFITNGMLCCLKLAMNSWEEKLQLTTPVRFFFGVSDKLETNVAVSTKVTYAKQSSVQSVADNLYAQTRSSISVNDSIIINSTFDWKSINGDYFNNGSISLLTYLNRNIARILGFGCSLVKRNTNIGFSVIKAPSTFDNLVYNGNAYLNSLRSVSSRYFNDFFSKNITLKSNAFEYNMWNSGKFENGISGCFFSLGYDNILEYEIFNKSAILPINHETLDVLEKVGWKVKEHDFDIVCDKTDNMGFGSLFDVLTFTLKSQSSISNVTANWQYQVYDASLNKYKTLTKNNGSVFIVNPSVYEKSLDSYHCVQSRIVATVNGNEYYFPLTLDASPLINDIKISDVNKIDANRYKFNLDIDQKGATGGYVLANDETGAMHQYDYSGKQICISGLYADMNAYLYISLSNDYAVSTRYIFGDIYNNGNAIVHKAIAINKLDVEHNVSLSGQKVQDGKALLLDIGDTENPVDSIEWYLYAGEYVKKLSKVRGNNHIFNFIVSKASLDMEIRKDAEDESTEYILGKSWNRASTSSDEQYFLAKVFMRDINGSYYSYYKFTDFSFDVLPSEPVIDVARVYDVCEDGVDLIKADLKITADNFSYIYFWVANYGDWTDKYTCYPDIFNGVVPDVVNLYFGDKADQFYCVSCNEYGYYKSKVHCIDTTPVDVVNGANFKMWVANGVINIAHDNPFSVSVYSLDGVLQCRAVSTMEFSKALSKGCYILKLCEDKYKKELSKKVIIN